MSDKPRTVVFGTAEHRAGMDGLEKMHWAQVIESLTLENKWLRAEIERLQADARAYANVMLSEENDALIEENKRLRAALTFYAEVSWSELDNDLQDHYENGVFMGCSPGLKAKRALAGEQEKVG